MAAPRGDCEGRGGAWFAALLLAAVALRRAEAVSEPTTVAFDVRPGGVVHSFSQNVGPGGFPEAPDPGVGMKAPGAAVPAGPQVFKSKAPFYLSWTVYNDPGAHWKEGNGQDKFTCTFTYASQGGTNEQWQMSLGTSEDHQHFTCTIWRPQGKSYLYFTQFKAEVRGAEIEYAMAYSKAAFERESDVPLKNEEFEVTKAAVAHRPGAFKAELSKLVIVAKAARSEL